MDFRNNTLLTGSYRERDQLQLWDVRTCKLLNDFQNVIPVDGSGGCVEGSDDGTTWAQSVGTSSNASNNFDSAASSSSNSGDGKFLPAVPADLCLHSAQFSKKGKISIAGTSSDGKYGFMRVLVVWVG